jgi:HSP20 family molecular chaperone IbpA
MRYPFGELLGLHRDFDEMFNRILTGRPLAEWPQLPTFNTGFTPFNTGFTPFNTGFTPTVEAYLDKEAHKYVCRVTLPAVEPKQVEVGTQGNVLTIRGERKFPYGVKQVELLEHEVPYGKFERTVTLPEGVIVEKLTAEYVNGMLEITAPIVVAALPRTIEIKTIAPYVKQVTA